MRIHMRTAFVFPLLAACMLVFASVPARAWDQQTDLVAGGRFVGHKGEETAIAEFSAQGNKAVLTSVSDVGNVNKLEGTYAIKDSSVTIAIEHRSDLILFTIVDGNTLEYGGITFSRGKDPGVETTYELLAKDADLSRAPGVILEPDSPPQNLGGWKTDSPIVVAFDFTATKTGRYKVTLVASREPAGDAQVMLSHGNEKEMSTRLTVANTGSWAEYREFTAASPIFLVAGKRRLMVGNFYSQGEYVMNLRSIKLVRILE